MKTVKKFCFVWLLILATIPSFPVWAQDSHDHQHAQARKDPHRDRYQWQLPARVMDEIGIKEGMSVADVGAGDGYFTFIISERIGDNGMVYASDIDHHSLEVIRNRCKKDGLRNISVILGKEDDPLLPEKKIDTALMVNTIHLIAHPTILLKNMSRSLKPGGYLVIIQWDAEKMGRESKDWDPKDRARYTLRTNLRTIYDAGFEVVQIKDFLPMQKIYICQPSD